jgi:PAS domain S-box-containing protein
MPRKPDTSIGGLNVFSSFIWAFSALVMLLAAVAATHYYTNYVAQEASLRASETLNVELAGQRLASEIDAVVSDLAFLREYLQSNGLNGNQGHGGLSQVAVVSHVFANFAGNKRLYDQIRYINEKGAEVVRVNYRDGHPSLVPPEQLQNKAGRYYFREGLRLDASGIYISPLDLNVEDGRIETPYKPMMRFVAPVFDRFGKRRGLLVLNYLGDRLIRNFLQAAANIADHIHLLNGDGYWLRSPMTAEHEWSFMFGREQRFGNHYPVAWSEIQGVGEGQVLTEGGLFTFATVLPVAVAMQSEESERAVNTSAAHQWKVVSHVPIETLVPSPAQFVRQHSPLYIGMLILLSLVAYFLAYTHSRHRLAAEQNQYEKRFRHTLENISLAAVSVLDDGTITFCNEQFLNITGWRYADVMGANWVSTFVPEDRRERVSQLLGSLDEPGTPQRLETEILTREGEQRLIAWHLTPTHGPNGQIQGVTGIGEDITEKRRNETQVRKLSGAVEQSPSIVIITNRQGLIEYTNPKFTEVTGYTAEEVIGRNPSVLKSGETTPEEYSDLWATIAAGGEWRGEFHNRRKDGELYWESARIAPLRDSSGQITHYLAVKEDITERKRLEATVDERNRELNKAQALAAMGQMASMIAHDLRNPLSSVKMGMQILNKKFSSLDEESGELCHIGLEQIDYMENILSDMLTYSRPEALKPDWLSIDKVLESTLNMLRRKLDQHGANIELEYESGLPAFPGDSIKLRQVLSNLIMNAAQAMDENPLDQREITIRCDLLLDQSGSYLRIRICDQGKGFGSVETDQLFEPFFTQRTKGTGLGLAIVRQIVEQHRGKVSLQSRVPRGVCAVVMLPTVPEQEAAFDPQQREAAGAS